MRYLTLLLTFLLMPSQELRDLKHEDTRIGEAFFHLQHQGSDIVMEPILHPSFKLVIVKGDGIEPSSMVKCWVIHRTVYEANDHGYDLTVLKCGNNEYALAEIDFQFDDGKGGGSDSKGVLMDVRPRATKSSEAASK